jgi:hypothetical protein
MALMCFSIAVCLAGGRKSHSSAMPPGAFLRSPASTAEALRKEIASDPAVVTRYARLFHLSPSMVKRAFAGLHLMSLPKDEVFAVHYVHTGEVIGYKLRRVRRGTPVYALPDGTPVLVRVCGNPLRSTVTLSYPDTEPTATDSIPDFTTDEPVQSLHSSPGSTLTSLRSARPLPGMEPAPFIALIKPGATHIPSSLHKSVPDIVRRFPAAGFPSWIGLLPMAILPTGFIRTRDVVPGDRLPTDTVHNPAEKIEDWTHNVEPTVPTETETFPPGDKGTIPTGGFLPPDHPMLSIEGSSSVPEPGMVVLSIAVLSTGVLFRLLLPPKRG